jgi:Icc-related predicted phosphoesterase
VQLHILSDLHLEFAGLEIPNTSADVVVLAGDIHLGREGRRWARAQFGATPVIYVLGNHEFYGHAHPELIKTLQRETDGSNIHVLENSMVEFAGFTFLGCSLWTDFRIAPDPKIAMLTAEDVMSDFRLIRNSEQNRRLTALDTVKLHHASVGWLSAALQKVDRKRTIVVTHHAPSRCSEAPYHRGTPLSPAFSSDLDDLVEPSGVPLWIHGHTHYNVDYQLGLTRILTNQRGYPDQFSKGFDPGLVVNL